MATYIICDNNGYSEFNDLGQFKLFIDVWIDSGIEFVIDIKDYSRKEYREYLILIGEYNYGHLMYF